MTLAAQPRAAGTPAATSSRQRPETAACEVLQPLMKARRTLLPRKTFATISSDVRRSVRPRSSSKQKTPCPLMTSPWPERWTTCGRHSATRSASSSMPPVSAKWATISPFTSAEARSIRSSSRSIVELVLIHRRGGQEQDAERAGPRGGDGPGRRSSAERPGGVAADRQAGRDLDQLPGEVEQGRDLGAEDHLARFGRGFGEGLPRGGEPGVEQGPAHRPEVLGVSKRPVPLAEEGLEPAAGVVNPLGLIPDDLEGVAERLFADRPAGPATGVNLEGERGHHRRTSGIPPWRTERSSLDSGVRID